VEQNISCPSCLHLLDKKPTRKSICPYCSEHIIVRNGSLYSISGWEKEELNRRREVHLGFLGYSHKDYLRHYDQLKKKFGCDPEFLDIVSSMINQKIIQLMKLEPNEMYREMKSLYINYADILVCEGKDNKDKLREANKYEALFLQTIGFDHIEVKLNNYIKNPCEFCGQESGKKYSMSELIEKLSDSKSGAYCCCYFDKA
jgi:hypothetical protein